VERRRFLTEVELPNIVKVFSFVQHENSSYIVMEYAGGKSLKKILDERREANGGKPDPLAPADALAYILEILAALGYRHDSRLLFCDLKPDNVVQTRHSLELIDLAGVYRMDDPTGAVFGTIGYDSPEIASGEPSIASDLYTVARTLAMLCIEFPAIRARTGTLPPRETVPLFEQHDSLYIFLLKATTPNAADRYQSERWPTTVRAKRDRTPEPGANFCSSLTATPVRDVRNGDT
jgi:serine/threonine-protein kinase PknG